MVVEPVPYEEREPTIWIEKCLAGTTYTIQNHFESMGYPVKYVYVTGGLGELFPFKDARKGDLHIRSIFKQLLDFTGTDLIWDHFKWAFIKESSNGNVVEHSGGESSTPDELEKVIVKYFGLPKVKGRLINA